MSRGVVLAAGAGTGKTYSLVGLALQLYAADHDPARVWAVTFTEKAAAELLARLSARVRALAGGGNEPGLPERPASFWEGVARALPSAPVGTFHALCAGLLRDHAGEAGVDPGFAVLEEAAAGELLERTREEVLLAELADAQGPARRLVRELGGLWALRQALTGLHHRLVEEGRDPVSLVRDPSGGLLPPFVRAPSRLPDACTRMHGAIQQVLGTEIERLAPHRELIARELPRLSRCEPSRLETWYPVVASLAATSHGRGGLPKGGREAWDAFKDALESLLDAIAAAAQVRVGLDLAGLLERVEAAYGRRKKELRVLDFGDMVRGARDLLRDHLEVRRALKARTSALLVDEFQDTNSVQLDVVHLLGEERSTERALRPGERASELPLEPGVLRAVGDRKQAIYEFRGADVALFSRLIDRAREGRDFDLRTLQQSRRSLPGIVRFVNQVIGRVLGENRMREFEVGWRTEEDALATVREEPPGAGYPAVELLESDPTLPVSERRPLEAALVARHVAELLASGRPVEVDGERRPVEPPHVALLLRSFGAVELYRRALAERGVASLVLRGRGFFGAREVRDLAALLLAIADPHDTFASAAVLRSPLAGVSDDALVLLAAQRRLALAAHARGDAADLAPADARKIAVVGPVVARLHREIDRLGPHGVLARAIEELGYEPVLAASFEGEQRLANVRKLLAWVAARRGSGALSLAQELLARADDEGDREPPAEAPVAGGDAVHVMTIHAAKGLEYPVVIVPELGFTEPQVNDPVIFDRNLGLAVRAADPVGKRHLDAHGRLVQEELEARRDAESARLLYVAATRARDLLVLCGEGKGRSWRAKLDRALEGASGLLVRIPPPPPDALEIPPDDTPGETDPGGLEPVAVLAGPAIHVPGAIAPPRAATAPPPPARDDGPAPPDGPAPGSGVTAFAQAPAPAGSDRPARGRRRVADGQLDLFLAPAARRVVAPATDPRAGQDPAAAPSPSALPAGPAPGATSPSALPASPAPGATSPSALPAAPPSPSAQAPGSPAAALLREAPALAAQVPALVPLRLAPGRYVAAVTELAELARCERRFFYKQVVGLEEFPGRAAEPGSDPDDLDRLERGHLAHRLLERVDLAWAARDAAGAVATALERDPARHASEAAPVAGDVRALLESPFGVALARAPRVWREVPFVLEIEGDGAHLVLRGQIDLLFVDDEGVVHVVDHKHASSAGQPADAYAFQLATYALAASRVLPGESRIRTGLSWLKDRGVPSMRDVTPHDLASHERTLAACAAALDRIRTAGRHEKLEGPSACGGCGYVARCFRDPAPDAGADPA